MDDITTPLLSSSSCCDVDEEACRKGYGRAVGASAAPTIAAAESRDAESASPIEPSNNGSRSAIRCTSSDANSTCCSVVPDSADATASCSAAEREGCCVMTHTCLAIVRPDNSAVDVFDARGRCRTFRVESKRGVAAATEKLRLCFSSHGAAKDTGGLDGMLTPCFDKNGEHDEPDEGCPCGEDEEHLHAHYHRPEICAVVDAGDAGGGGGGGCARTAAARKKATDWRFLSQLTLVPDDDDDGESAGAYVPITESMPKECNSAALKGHLAERAVQHSHWLRYGTDDGARRMYPVRHEDHIDFFVHKMAEGGREGELIMEHPSCATCGEVDVHGRFRFVHTRSWRVDDGPRKKGEMGSRIDLHFFEAYDGPFRLLDALAGLFDSESGRVHAVRPETVAARAAAAVEEIPPPSSDRVGRSQFFVKEICCASEVPQIKLILQPVEGLVEVSVNPTTKTVYVDHDVDVISANDIATALDSQGFGAVIKKDAVVVMDQMSGIPMDVFVNSTFDVTNHSKLASIATSEADKGEIADVIQACLDQEFLEGQVRKVNVNEEDNVLTVEHNPYYLTASGIAKVLDSHGYNVSIVSDGGADGMWALPQMTEGAEDTIEQETSSVRWSVVFSGVFWIISMFSLVGGNWEYLQYVALLSVAFGLPPIALKAFKTLRRCHFDVNCMMLFAILGALPLQDYTESAAVTFLFAISEALETRATARARNALSAIVCLRPERANVINPVTKDMVTLPASAVAVGTLVSVKAGDKVPCDGIVVEGRSAIDESSLTGESRPVNKSPGMQVSGGTINAGNTQLVIKTTTTSNNSAVSRLIRLVEEAQANRSDTEKLVDSFARIYTPIVVLAALCMCTIPWAFGTEVGTTWARNGLITIVIACPCALIISTPVTYVAGLAAAAQRGVIVKGGQHLEGLGRVKSIAFDKTGTLSQGTFQLLHFNIIGKEHSREEVFGYLALMEAPASHPLSDAIVKGAANEQIEIPKLQLKNHTLLPGEGISANVAGRDVYVGNKRLFQRLSLYDDLAEDVKVLTERWAQDGGTTGFINIEGAGIVGTYCVADKIRDEADDVVKSLKKMGIEIIMLTGDQRPAAIGIGSQIGLEENDIKSELLPEDKLAEIHSAVQDNKVKKKCWKAKRAVMMVGDGVNDAPALALADVSVAMGEGAALAMDTADITLMDSNLNKLLYIVRMGRRVVGTIIENVVFSLIVKAVVMGFALAGKASLWAAIASDVGAMLIVTLNGMKLLPRKSKEPDLAQVVPL